MTVALGVALLLSPVMAVHSPAYAAGATPDGTHRLIEIFPGGDSSALAEDIARQIGAPDTDFMPVTAAAFDAVTTISLPAGGVRSLAGIEYCHSLTHLYLPGNLLTDDSFATLGSSTSVTHLDISGNGIGDIGAAAAASKLPSLGFLDISGNRVGSAGLAALRAAGIARIEADDQTLTAAALSGGRAPVTHAVVIAPEHASVGAISDGGSYDASTHTVTWPATNKSGVYTYAFAGSGYSGVVSVPFNYVPFVYHVTFVSGVGADLVVDVADEAAVARPENPVREGYAFSGWSLSAEGEEMYDFQVPVTGDLTLYARWTLETEDAAPSAEKQPEDSQTTEPAVEEDDSDGEEGSGSAGGGDDDETADGRGSSPDTGDRSNPVGYILFCALSYLALVVCLGLYTDERRRRV
jgi:uncharacterized repeat protein (TIGR02543 family)